MYKNLVASVITFLCFVGGVAGGAIAVGYGLRWAADSHDPVVVAPPTSDVETGVPTPQPEPGPPLTPEEPSAPTEPEQPAPPPPVHAEPMPTTPSPKPEPKPEPTPQPQPPAPVTPGPALRRISQTDMVVALTFDDGPTRFTKEFLAVLEQEQVPATFFWLSAQARESIAEEVIAAGHQIGNHTASHVRLTELTYEEQALELHSSTEALSAMSGEPVVYFRPPFGAYNADTVQLLEEMGMVMAMWDVDSRDWELAQEPDQIIANVMAKVRPGSVILLHERIQTLQVLPDLIAALREAGYSFSPLPALEQPMAAQETEVDAETGQPTNDESELELGDD